MTLRYADGTMAVYNTAEEAQAQAVHDHVLYGRELRDVVEGTPYKGIDADGRRALAELPPGADERPEPFGDDAKVVIDKAALKAAAKEHEAELRDLRRFGMSNIELHGAGLEPIIHDPEQMPPKMRERFMAMLRGKGA